ncbi:unnamed protein product, partial [Allacma fusca]
MEVGNHCNHIGEMDAVERARGEMYAVERARCEMYAVELTPGEMIAVERTRGEMGAVERTRGEMGAVERTRGEMDVTIERSKEANEDLTPEANEDLTSEANDLTPQRVMVVGTFVNLRHVPDITRFLSWIKLVRTTAWVRRFARNWMVKEKRSGELTAHELFEAEEIWWKVVQQISFADELQTLGKGRSFNVNSRLKFLSPFKDSNGILRMR